MTMDRQRWKEIEAIYQAAMDKAEDQRRAYLDQACADDAELRSEVEALLAVHESQGAGLEVPALEQVAQTYRKVASGRLVGQRLGPCEILSLLGKGGMGEVYLARDTRLDRQVALKVLPLEVTQDPERLKRFVREAKAASALDHPNIATIYELGQAAGVHYIVMEYVKGETLEARVRKGRLGLGEILDISIQVADALDEAHRQGITHRDIKPANLMLTPRGQVKVLDFGLAKRTPREKPAQGTAAITESQTTPGVIMGTVDYMSPEQVLGQEVDQRSDLFSLGVVLYQMATGTLPFKGDTSGAIFNAILNQTPPSPVRLNPELPARLGEIIDKALEKDREVRYQVASEIRADLRRLKRDSDSGKTAVSQTEVTMARRGVRWLALAIGAGLALIALVAGLGFWSLRQGRETPEAPLTAVPLTSYPGAEKSPSLSPDGTQVAFEWRQEGQKCHIYIKQIGIEAPFQLTHAAVDDFSPAWSPDGRFIAFFRQFSPDKSALMLIPQRGGPERRLVETDWSDFQDPHLAWTPDSKWLVFSLAQPATGGGGLFLLAVDTLEKRRLTTAAGDISPAFSPNGRTLAFTRTYGIYLLPLGKDYEPQGTPEKVAATGEMLSSGGAWTADGREIVFSSGYGTRGGLWRVSTSKGAKPRRLAVPSETAGAPAISRQGNRLAYEVDKSKYGIWRVDLHDPGRNPGTPFKLISSTRSEFTPAYSPDGKRIAFSSDRSGDFEIWVSNSDGLNATPLTSFKLGAAWAPRWSPDGRSIVFLGDVAGNQEVYVISPDGGAPRRLTTDPANDKFPCWSRDSQTIYFDSNRSGSSQIWKMPANGGKPVQVTPNGVDRDLPQESPDGEFLYYQKDDSYPVQCSVCKMPVGGGNETKVLDSVHCDAGWAALEQGIYFFTKPDEKGYTEMRFYEFATGKTRKLLGTERIIDVLLAVSPDGRTILYTQVDESGSDLMLVENFK